MNHIRLARLIATTARCPLLRDRARLLLRFLIDRERAFRARVIR